MRRRKLSSLRNKHKRSVEMCKCESIGLPYTRRWMLIVCPWRIFLGWSFAKCQTVFCQIASNLHAPHIHASPLRPLPWARWVIYWHNHIFCVGHKTTFQVKDYLFHAISHFAMISKKAKRIVKFKRLLGIQLWKSTPELSCKVILCVYPLSCFQHLLTSNVGQVRVCL